MSIRTSLDDGASNLNVYVGDDEKIHFTNWAGADSVLPFSKGGGEPINLGQITSYDASSISGYQNLTINNFIIEVISGNGPATGTWNPGDSDDAYAQFSGFTVSKSYNNTTGMFTLSGVTYAAYLRSTAAGRPIKRSANGAMTYRVWLII